MPKNDFKGSIGVLSRVTNQSISDQILYKFYQAEKRGGSCIRLFLVSLQKTHSFQKTQSFTDVGKCSLSLQECAEHAGQRDYVEV